MSDDALSTSDWRSLADLWHDVAEAAPVDMESFAHLALERLCAMTHARDGHAVFGISPAVDDPALPFGGWGPVGMSTPLSDPADIARLDEYMRQEDFLDDAHSERLLSHRGQLRAGRLRNWLSLDAYLNSPAGWLFGELDAGDRVSAVVPVAQGVELIIGVDRARADRAFSARDELLMREALRGLARAATRVARGLGIIEASAPLSEREHQVLRHLLTGRSEKQIAAEIGLTSGSTHQVVVRIFRKFEVQSRAELMARWIGTADLGAS